MKKKLLPIGISTLAKIHPSYCYVDKTSHIAKLAHEGQYYFLSRPRRFGKSLLVDTLKQAFLGNKALFNGLYLENHWDWETSYPVIHFDFGTMASQHAASEARLSEFIWTTLNEYANTYAVVLKSQDFSFAFQELIRAIFEKTNQQVVILVDEYDKPLLDVIANETLAPSISEMLKGLYGVIKANDAYLRFVFLTGVTKFSKVGIFSGLNNLNDISLDASYADICGYTETDLNSKFSDYLKKGNVDRKRLKEWYNGYNFNGDTAKQVYNPFDILLFFDKNYTYRSYWFETGTPTFLVKLLQKNQYYFPDFESIRISEDALSSFDIDRISPTVILFQTGYLTIKNTQWIGGQLNFILSYPNFEVKVSLNNALTEIAAPASQRERTKNQIIDCLQGTDLTQLQAIFKAHFSSIPHDWFRKNVMAEFEGFYASIVYSFFCALGYQVIAEDATSFGKIDLTVILPDKIVILEFKLNQYGDAKSALQQIKDKKYADKYLNHHKPIYIVGMSFDVKERNVVGCLVEVW